MKVTFEWFKLHHPGLAQYRFVAADFNYEDDRRVWAVVEDPVVVEFMGTRLVDDPPGFWVDNQPIPISRSAERPLLIIHNVW